MFPEQAPLWMLSPTLCFSPSLYLPLEGRTESWCPSVFASKREADFKVFVLQKRCISFHPHIPSPPATLIPSSSLLLSHKKTERKNEKKERNMLPGLEKSSFPRSGVIMLMEGRTGKRKCFANVENFWPAFFLRPVCQGEKEIGGWMKYELMQLQCL